MAEPISVACGFPRGVMDPLCPSEHVLTESTEETKTAQRSAVGGTMNAGTGGSSAERAPCVVKACTPDKPLRSGVAGSSPARQFPPPADANPHTCRYDDEVSVYGNGPGTARSGDLCIDCLEPKP